MTARLITPHQLAVSGAKLAFHMAKKDNVDPAEFAEYRLRLIGFSAAAAKRAIKQAKRRRRT